MTYEHRRVVESYGKTSDKPESRIVARNKAYYDATVVIDNDGVGKIIFVEIRTDFDKGLTKRFVSNVMSLLYKSISRKKSSSTV